MHDQAAEKGSCMIIIISGIAKIPKLTAFSLLHLTIPSLEAWWP